MFLFRFISFSIRVIVAFVLTLILQIQWDGKTLEHYLTHWGRQNSIAHTLKKVSEDGVFVIRHITSTEEKKQVQKRQISQHLKSTLKDLEKHVTFPNDFLEEKKPQEKKK